MPLQHAYTQTVADGTATSVVRPSDWNSAHQMVQYVSGNTLGASSATGTNIVYQGSNNITMSVNQGANAATIVFDNGPQLDAVSIGGNTAGVGANISNTNLFLAGGNNVTISQNANSLTINAAAGGGPTATYLTYQNRQLGASSSTQFTNGQVWMVPFRVAGGVVSASTLQYIQSLGGSYTSAVAATHGETMRWCIYSANATNSSQFDSMSSGSCTWQVWNSGTSSASYAINGSTSSSAGTGVLSQASGVRMMQIPYGAILNSGLYVLGLNLSTSTAGYASLFSRYGVVLDAPMPLSMGNNFGPAPATTVGYVDAGTFSTTSAGMPVSVNFSQILQHSNLVPYFKIGAI